MNNNLLEKAKLSYLKATLAEYEPEAVALSIKEVIENKINSVTPQTNDGKVIFDFYKKISFSNLDEKTRKIIHETLTLKKDFIREELINLLDLPNVDVAIDISFSDDGKLVPAESQMGFYMADLRNKKPRHRDDDLVIKIKLIFPEEDLTEKHIQKNKVKIL